MKYNIYLKRLGMSRRQFWRLKHEFLVPYQIKEKVKYGTTCHEMWRLPMIMTCEIYPRLKRLQEKYNEVCSFKYDEFGKPFIETHSSLQPGSEGWHKLFVEFHNKNLTRVIKSLEHSIKCYLDMDYEIKHDTLEQQREDRTAMALIGWNFWSLGL